MYSKVLSIVQLLSFPDVKLDSITVPILPVIFKAEVPDQLAVHLLPDLHPDVVDPLALLGHGDAGPGPGHVLDLQGGVGPLPEPLPVADTVQVLGLGRGVSGEAEEVEAEAVLGDVLDGEQLHPELGLVERETALKWEDITRFS